jgi:hypothetical protein
VPDDISVTMARDVASILQDGEVLAVTAIVTASDPGATGPVHVGHELGNLVVRLLSLGFLGEDTQLVRLALWGRAVDGPPSSLAHSLHALIHEASWAKLVITDRRVIVARGELIEPGHYDFSTVGALPRSAVTGARPAPRGLLRRGRIVLRCADASSVAVNILTKQSSTVVDMLNAAGAA